MAELADALDLGSSGQPHSCLETLKKQPLVSQRPTFTYLYAKQKSRHISIKHSKKGEKDHLVCLYRKDCRLVCHSEVQCHVLYYVQRAV